MAKKENTRAVKNTEKNEIDDIFYNKQVALSNSLIQAREKTSLLESKIELLAIYRMGEEIKTKKKQDGHGNSYDVHYVEILSKEIRQLMGVKGGSIYNNIEAAAYELKTKIYIYRDKGSEQFVMKSLYGDVAYDRGVLTIDFNPDTEYLFRELQGNFTRLRLDIAFRFQTNGGFQMYKLLKSHAYELPSPDITIRQEEMPVLPMEYSLSELRLQLGYVDLSQKELQKESMKASPDNDRLSKHEKKPKYKRWIDFYNRVIAPGEKEINQISDIYIADIEKKCSAHGKVEGIVIKMQHNLDYYKKNLSEDVSTDTTGSAHKNPLSEDEIDDLIDKMRKFSKEDLRIRDYKAIAEAADYDLDKIKKAFKLADMQENIENYTGWVIQAVKNGYEIKSVKRGRRKNSFDVMESAYTDIDFKELESLLLEN